MGDFKTVLKQLRIARGMTQGELADAIGITRSRLSMYELGQREPNFETAETIADFFNVDIDYLLGRTNKTTILPQSIGSSPVYYLNEETAKIAQEMFEKPNLRWLYHNVPKMPPEDIAVLKQMAEALYKKEYPDDN